MLTTGQVRQAISNYLKRSVTEFAVMIDGGWGVGKTYLLNQYILPSIKEIKYFHISLYGLSNISDIESEIYKSVSIGDNNGSSVPLDENLLDSKMPKGAKLGGISYAVQFSDKQNPEHSAKLQYHTGILLR